MIIISFLLHWLLFFSVACLARLLLVFIKYPVRFSVKDLLVLTVVIAVISGILHSIGFIFFKVLDLFSLKSIWNYFSRICIILGKE